MRKRGRRRRRNRREDLGEGQRQRAPSRPDDQESCVPREQAPPQQLVVLPFAAPSCLFFFSLFFGLAERHGRRRHRPRISRDEHPGQRFILFSFFPAVHQRHGLDVAVPEHQEAVPRRRRRGRRRSP